jgi:hypothetical protein
MREPYYKIRIEKRLLSHLRPENLRFSENLAHGHALEDGKYRSAKSFHGSK